MAHNYHTNTLTGCALDCAVAIALGLSLAVDAHGSIVTTSKPGAMPRHLRAYTSPDLAAPIIWGAHICLNSLTSVGISKWEATLFAATPGHDVSVKADSPTRAGLLCFVIAKLGELVAIPDAVHEVLQRQK